MCTYYVYVYMYGMYNMYGMYGMYGMYDRQTSDDGRSQWRLNMVYEDVGVDVCRCRHVYKYV